MLSQSIIKKKDQEKFTIIQNKNSVRYELNEPKELKAIEVSADLYSAKFYYSEVMTEQQDEKQSYEFTEEHRRIKGIVSSAIYPPLPEIGHVCTDSECIEIYGMRDYSVMPSCNKAHIERTVTISEHLHPLEWILTKARNSGLFSNALYEKIRIDVRHRVIEMQETAKANQSAYQQVLGQIKNKYILDNNFKRIKSSADVLEFADKIIAYVSDSYYFSNGSNAITFPIKTSGQKVRFAQMSQKQSVWDNCEPGYKMDCFLKPEASGSTHALVNSKIKEDSKLLMRLATIQELEFLKATLEFDQGRLHYRAKKEDIRIIANEIDCANISDVDMAQSAFGSESHMAKRRKGNECNNFPSSSSCAFFAVKKATVTPVFKPFTSGTVDWKRENENQDKSVPPAPSKVYLIKGGKDAASREDKACELALDDRSAMYAIYNNKDKSEHAVVLSCDHDTFNLMNFATAKKIAGEKLLPVNFKGGIFENKNRFGVIDISHTPTFSFRNFR